MVPVISATHVAGLALALLLISVSASPAAGAKPGDDVDAVAALLPAQTRGLGRPVTDRAAWRGLAKHASYQGVLRRGEELLKQPIPDSPDDLYLDYSKTGNRTRWQRVAGVRRGRVGYLTLAECLENKGRFLKPLAETVAAICAERTWVMPAHDGGLRNFKGQVVDIDLGSGHLAWSLATAYYLLGDRLDATTRGLIRDNLRRRIWQPYLDMVRGKRKPNWWMLTTNNWNAVCLACVTGSALAVIEPAKERAEFVVAARKYARNFLAGFTPDGYCSEGLGYWGYGFGYYVLLAETIWQATEGRIDMMAGEKVRMPATFPPRIHIRAGVYPAFADCSVSARPGAELTRFLSRRYGLGAKPDDDGKMVHASSSLPSAMMYSFPNSATTQPAAAKAAELAGVRNWFSDAGVLICRPAVADTTCRMAVALKGGHNAEHHNHNDVGSYVVVVDRRAVLLDPGAEVYTARTFSRQRYVSKVLNSFGHPVPRVAGKLQNSGRTRAAKVLKTDFTDQTDTYAIDIAPAYGVKELTKLQRTFHYSRQGAGRLIVEDEAAFSGPQEFETALITLGKWKRLSDTALVVYDSNAAVRVDIDSGGEPVTVEAETIQEDVKTRSLPTRIAIRLRRPVKAAKVKLTVTPTTYPTPAGESSVR